MIHKRPFTVTLDYATPGHTKKKKSGNRGCGRLGVRYSSFHGCLSGAGFSLSASLRLSGSIMLRTPHVLGYVGSLGVWTGRPGMENGLFNR